MKKIFIILTAASVIFAACQKAESSVDSPSGGDMLTIHLVPAPEETKTQIGYDDATLTSYSLKWEVGDQVSYFIGSGTAVTATVNVADGTISIPAQGDDVTVKIVYPAVEDGAAYTDPTVPTYQYVSADDDYFNGKNLPMTASAEVTAGATSVDAPYTTVGGLYRFAVTGSAIGVKKLVVDSYYGSAGSGNGAGATDIKWTGVVELDTPVDLSSTPVYLYAAMPTGVTIYGPTLIASDRFYTATPVAFDSWSTHANTMVQATINVTSSGIALAAGSGRANCYILAADGGTYYFDATTIGNGDAGIISGAGFHTDKSGISPQTVDYADMAAGAEKDWKTRDGLSENKYDILLNEYTFQGNNLHKSFNSANDSYGIAMQGGIVRVKTKSGTYGDVEVAVKDASGNILWSWMLWIPETAIGEDQTYSNGKKYMDRNLGAFTATAENNFRAFGVAYQWGRKDPLMRDTGKAAVGETMTETSITYNGHAYNRTTLQGHVYSGSIAKSIQNPTAYLVGVDESTTACWNWLESDNSNLWGSTKTIYDPCPAGYKVPDADSFSAFSTTDGKSSAVTTANYAGQIGYNFCYDGTNTSFFPACGIVELYRDAAPIEMYIEVANNSSYIFGEYWTNNHVSGNNGGCFKFSRNGIDSSIGGSRAKVHAASVRCQKID